MRSSRLRSTGRWLRLAMLVLAILSLASDDLVRATLVYAKEVDVIGTVDCGQRSGKRCSFDNTLVLRTDSLTGELAPARIDITWIKGLLPGLDQDDEITLTVELLPDG